MLSNRQTLRLRLRLPGFAAWAMSLAQHGAALQADKVSPARWLAWAVNVLGRRTAQRPGHLTATASVIPGPGAWSHQASFMTSRQPAL